MLRKLETVEVLQHLLWVRILNLVSERSLHHQIGHTFMRRNKGVILWNLTVLGYRNNRIIILCLKDTINWFLHHSWHLFCLIMETQIIREVSELRFCVHKWKTAVNWPSFKYVCCSLYSITDVMNKYFIDIYNPNLSIITWPCIVPNPSLCHAITGIISYFINYESVSAITVRPRALQDGCQCPASYFQGTSARHNK